VNILVLLKEWVAYIDRNSLADGPQRPTGKSVKLSVSVYERTSVSEKSESS